MVETPIRVFIFLLFLSWSTSHITQAQKRYVINSSLTEIHEHLLSTELEVADSIINTLKPDNAFKPYMVATSEFLDIMLKGDATEFEKTKRIRNTRIENLKGEDIDSPFHLFCIAELYLYESMLSLRFGNRWQAGKSAVRAYRILEKNIEKFPDFKLSYKTLGLLELTTSYSGLNSLQKWTLKTFTPIDVDQEYGLFSLKEAMEYAKRQPGFLSDYVFITSAYINMQILGYPEEAIRLLTSLTVETSQSPLIAYFLSMAYLKEGMGPQSEQCLMSVKPNADFAEFPYYLYLKGKVLTLKENGPGREYLLSFLRNNNQDHFVKEAYWRLALTAFTSKDQKTFETYRHLTLKKGTTEINSDKAAEWEASYPDRLYPELIKAKNRFDFGDYTFALSILSEINPNHLSDYQLEEYQYRLGRVYQALDKHDQAIQHYENVLKQNIRSGAYYRCNAALQKGILHEKKEELDEAKNSFNTCLSSTADIYEDSIHRKARIHLKNLKE